MQAGYGADGGGVAYAPDLSEPVRDLDTETAGDAGDLPAPADTGAPEPATGPDGAARVTRSLAVLRHHGWTVLHDLHWPGRPGRTVDHVAVGRGGIVVVHVRSWSGTVSVADGWLRQNGFRRDRELDKAYAATAAIRGLLRPEHRAATIGLICLAEHDQELAPTSAGVPVVGRDHLVDVLRSTTPRLAADDVTEIGTLLAGRLTRDLIPGQLPRASVHGDRGRGSWPSGGAPWRR